MDMPLDLRSPPKPARYFHADPQVAGDRAIEEACA